MDNSLIAAERRRRIYDLALQEGAVSVSRLARMLGVVENTIRRDLDYLHGEGKVVRSHGGASVKVDSLPRPPYSETRHAHLAEKSWIGSAALEYLPASGLVFINAGSTTKQLAVRMPSDTQLCIYTNSLEIATLLGSGTSSEVFLMGGKIIREAMETDGTACGLLEDLYWDAAFLGISALDLDHGITSTSLGAAAVERSVIKNSRKLVALCDSSKLGRFSHVRVVSADSINLLITDKGASSSFVDQLSKVGVTIVLVGESGVLRVVPASERPRRGRRHE